MKKPKRITPEQYLTLVKLGMPVTVVASEDSQDKGFLIRNMLSDRVQETNRIRCKERATHPEWYFFTLVEDESTADES